MQTYGECFREYLMHPESKALGPEWERVRPVDARNARPATHSSVRRTPANRQGSEPPLRSRGPRRLDRRGVPSARLSRLWQIGERAAKVVFGGLPQAERMA